MKLKNVTIQNCGTGISAPADAHIEADGLNISECQQAIELRDPPSLLQHLGLASDTPPSELAKVLNKLNGSDITPEQVTGAVNDSNLSDWLGTGSNITTIINGIYQLHQSNLVQSVLATLPK